MRSYTNFATARNTLRTSSKGIVSPASTRVFNAVKDAITASRASLCGSVSRAATALAMLAARSPRTWSPSRRTLSMSKRGRPLESSPIEPPGIDTTESSESSSPELSSSSSGTEPPLTDDGGADGVDVEGRNARNAFSNALAIASRSRDSMR